MKWWEAEAITRGIRRRYREQWETARWQTWVIQATLCGEEYPFHSPSEMLTLPWEKPAKVEQSDEEYERIQQMIKEAQEHNRAVEKTIKG